MVEIFEGKNWKCIKEISLNQKQFFWTLLTLWYIFFAFYFLFMFADMLRLDYRISLDIIIVVIVTLNRIGIYCIYTSLEFTVFPYYPFNVFRTWKLCSLFHSQYWQYLKCMTFNLYLVPCCKDGSLFIYSFILNEHFFSVSF